jgi:hypothetical protein
MDALHTQISTLETPASETNQERDNICLNSKPAMKVDEMKYTITEIKFLKSSSQLCLLQEHRSQARTDVNSAVPPKEQDASRSS